MESNDFWAFFIIALIAGASIALVVSNSMTGYFAFPGFGQQQIATTPAPVTPTVPATPAAMPATPVNVPDAITMLKNSVVFQFYPVTSRNCNEICSDHGGICVDAYVEETALKNLRPVDCDYKAKGSQNETNKTRWQDVYCRCVSSNPGVPLQKTTAYEEYSMNAMKNYVSSKFGSVKNIPPGAIIYRPSTQGKLTPIAVTQFSAATTMTGTSDPRLFVAGQWAGGKEYGAECDNYLMPVSSNPEEGYYSYHWKGTGFETGNWVSTLY